MTPGVTESPELPCLTLKKKGYNEVQGEGAEAADEPGQVVDQVAALAVSRVRVLQQDAQTVRSVPQDDERKQEVRHPLRRLPLELWGRAEPERKWTRRVILEEMEKNSYFH